MNTTERKPVLIIGAARQGQALARFLCKQGTLVILNDKRTPEALESALKAMSDVPVEWVLGSHPIELLERVDTVCISGGVPLDLPIVKEALRQGKTLTNDSQIFMEAVKAPVIGITGSSGKTTTTTLVGRMAEAGVKPPRKVWVGGNIGTPLVEYLDEINAEDMVVLELSSFQLELMTLSPAIGAILNITPNHLDRHATMAAYTAAKAHILAYQHAGDTAVLNREDPGAWAFHSKAAGNLMTFGFMKPETSIDGTYLANNRIMLQKSGRQSELFPQSVIALRGRHNVANVLAACAIASAAGMDTDSMRKGIEGFGGVRHRLELVREVNGVRWYNDSIATAPERSLAALNAFDEPIVLLLGGRDKHLPWDELSQMVHRKVAHVILFGEAAELISNALGKPQKGDRLQSIERAGKLGEALEIARKTARQGDVVLLSPGGTSFDEFADFEQRGDFFREWVNRQ